MLPIDQDDEVDLCSDEPELTEILADGPISHVKKSKVSELESLRRLIMRMVAVFSS